MNISRESLKLHTAGKYNELSKIGIIELDLEDQEIFQMIEELITAKRNKSVLQINICDSKPYKCGKCNYEFYIPLIEGDNRKYCPKCYVGLKYAITGKWENDKWIPPPKKKGAI